MTSNPAAQERGHHAQLVVYITDGELLAIEASEAGSQRLSCGSGIGEERRGRLALARTLRQAIHARQDIGLPWPNKSVRPR